MKFPDLHSHGVIQLLFNCYNNFSTITIYSSIFIHIGWASRERLMGYSTQFLSHGQLGLWLHQQKRGEGSEYNLPVEIRAARPFKVKALDEILQTLLDRHPMLRATYHLEGEDVVQHVHDDARIEVDVVAAARHDEIALRRCISQEANRPFDLERGPVFRAHLFSRGHSDQTLLLNFHHIVADACSLNTLLDEFGQLYAGAISGSQAALPPTGDPYVGFSAWQRQLVVGEEGALLWNYWRDQLAGDVPSLDLPCDRPRTDQTGYAGSHHSIRLDETLVAAIGGLAHRHSVSEATVLLAAFFVLLHRYTGQDDVTVLFPRLGRPRRRFARTVGYFVNIGALRVDLSGNPSISTVLKRVRSAMQDHRSHQHMPWPVLVQRLAAKQSTNPGQLSQAVFNFVPEEVSVLGHEFHRSRFGGLDAEARFAQTDTWVDLDLRVLSGHDGARCDFIYNTDLWDGDSIERLAGHYCHLLGGMANSSQQRIGQLPLLTPHERQKILVEWNRTEADYPSEACIHDLIEAQAERHPNAIAVRGDGAHLTYRDLNRRADKLAGRLAGIGVCPECVVGLSLERVPDLIVGFLAILKAGGVYLPLDPRNPDERLRFMLKDSQARALLTSETLAARLIDRAACPNGHSPEPGPKVVFVDYDAEGTVNEPETNPLRRSTPDNLAYVIYTSGSTGHPKGIMVEHRSLCNLAEDLYRTYKLEPGNRVLQFASASFDASLFDFLLALTSGGQLCLAGPEASLPGQALVEFLRRERVTVAGLTPSAWALVPSVELPDLHTIKAGGEVLSAALVERWGKGRRLFNSYGPTEATVYAVRAEVSNSTSKPMIGRPTINTRVYILDRQGQPVPVGIPGDLYLGGVGLARGYVNRPDLTAERFSKDPFNPDPQARIYRTGDRARFRADGTIEFIGRDDGQVKIRGMRVELGEIEALLTQHESLSDCCVALQEGHGNDKQLVAYAVPNEGYSLNDQDLRLFLRRSLPEHMVPTAYVSLPELPLNNSGKIDRRALPLPEVRKPARLGSAPHDELGTQIVAIWKNILNVDWVGLDDNFFDVGGHSLAVVKVQNRLRRDLGVTCRIVDLFQHPTIRSLSNYLRKKTGDANGSHRSLTADSMPSVPFAEIEAAQGIAIIGMAGRFPGADSVDQLWSNLLSGVEAITDLDEDSLSEAGVARQLYDHPDYVKREGVLEGVDLFDASFFSLSPKDAAWMDPQQRLLIETSWQALEHAGYGAAEGRPSRTGVFAGIGASNYLSASNGHAEGTASEKLQLRLLNGLDFTATRIAYKLDLKGPCLSVQTACSTSLVAVHVACQSLRNRECDMALAGGASIALPHGSGYLYQEGHIFSPDGHCRAFDARARGTVRGSGAGVVVLKRLTDAVADGDFIWAVIKGSAVNNDGAGKVGFTAPSIEGQAAVIEAALRDANVGAETIGYVEAHGTGTFIGDPIELAGLTMAFGPYATKKGKFCAIGALKTNIGHLDAAAGVAGLIKSALALRHEVIPPTLYYETPNPDLNLDEGPFQINAALTRWPRGVEPRRAGTSSFGMGGTNAHVVLEEAPEATEGSACAAYQILPLSAASRPALLTMARNLAGHIRRMPDQSLADIAFTLQVGRSGMAHRKALICQDREHAALELDGVSDAATALGDAERELVFVFSGQGGQHAGMGRDLYLNERVFRDAFDDCSRQLADIAEIDPRLLLYPDDRSETADLEQLEAVIQPIFFSVQYAMAKLWLSWGLRPTALIGHSIGEYAAANLAGIMSLEDALKLTLVRGQLSQQLPPGAVLAVGLPAEELSTHLGHELSLAVINGPSQCVVSGPLDAVSSLHRQLQSESVLSRLIHASHAVHSFMLDPILPEFRSQIGGIKLKTPSIPLMSTVTGRWLSDRDAVDPGYWVRNLRETVNFADGIAKLLQRDRRAFIEIGPGSALTNLIRHHEATLGGQHVAIATMPGPGDTLDGRATVLNALGALWASGVKFDWTRLHSGERRHRVNLPTYPFERKRYWIGGGSSAAPRPDAVPNAPSVDPSDKDPTSSPAAVEWASLSGTSRDGHGTEQLLTRIFQDVLGINDVAATDRFFDLGGDSLAALSVVGKVDGLLRRKLPVAALIEHQTARNLARLLGEETGNVQQETLIPIQTKGSKPPIFCPHPYGGHVMFYYPLAKALGTDQPLFGLQARGLNGEAKPHSNIPDMAAEYIEAMKSVQPEGPYSLVGLSMGGCIAWEMACQLQDSGERAALLALLDSKADHNTESSSRSHSLALFGRRRVPVWLDENTLTLSILFPGLSKLWSELKEEDPDNQVEALLRIGRDRNIVPEMAEKQYDRLIAVAEANKNALQSYIPRRYEHNSVLFLAKRGLQLTSPADEADLGWRRYAHKPPKVIEVPGNHYSMVKPPHVSVLAKRLSTCLASGSTR